MEIQQHEENASSPEQLVKRFGRLHVLDDLLRLRAADAVQEPILAYPASDRDVGSYEYFTGRDLDSMVDQAVQILLDYGFKPPRGNRASVVALLTLSDMNMVVTFFALSRLGYAVMMLSPRLSAAACVSLLNVVDCDTILYGQNPSIRTTVGDILRLKLIACCPIIQRSALAQVDESSSVLLLNRSRDPEHELNKIALIVHSSGSTGLPKPLFLSQRAVLTHPMRGPGLTCFNSLPWFHMHGLSTALQAMYMRKTAYMWNASLPLTGSGLVAALEEARPEQVSVVPYVLQLVADAPGGLDVLRKSKLVSYGGAPCPDELGDTLVREGVSFGGSLGLTEAGLVAESISRPKGDPYWNYLRFFDNFQPFTWMKPISDSLYEAAYLQGHPSKTSSNSNDPPGSYHSRDVFTPHPTIPGRWKYVTRLDDRVNLVNGEKVLPLPIEGTINQDPLVQEAVVVGVGKTVPGLMVFRAEEAKDLSDDEYLYTIWPSIDDANSRAEQFSQISREMVLVLPHTAPCPRTDKGSLIRAQAYTQYAEVIENMYTNLEQAADGTLELDLPGTQDHLTRLVQGELGLSLSSATADLFADGVDSLKAIHLRRLVLRDFKIPGNNALGQNVVFETGSIARLAEYIHNLQNGKQITIEDKVLSMSGMIEKYSSFQQHTPNFGSTSKKTAVLTGATGSMGAHVLLNLLNDEVISAVYCLTRRAQPNEAVMEALSSKGLHVPASKAQKIIALNSSLDKPDLGVGETTLSEMQQSVSLIIHAAWPVNFNLPLSSFEPHVKGLYNLLQFSLSVHLHSPATTFFCSSVSTAFGASSPDIYETPLSDLNSALDMGYGRSKLVGEHIVSNAKRSGAKAYSLRIGQISGHSKKGLWNDSEALPLMIRSALTLKALPDLPDTTCSWLPVDKLASSILEIAGVCSHASPPSSPQSGISSNNSSCSNDGDDNGGGGGGGGDDDDTIYNLCNSRTFTWSSLLTTLRNSGFKFETVSFNTWLQMLRESEARGEEKVNPAVKLTDHYEAMHAQSPPGTQKQQPQEKNFHTDKAERDSVTLRDGPLRVIEDGILGCYAQDWLKRWNITTA